MDDRVAAFRRATWANLAGNALKIVVEGGIGLTFGSAALVANAGHSVADLVASLVVHIWGPTAFAGPDDEHQHGHERFEPLTALFAGGILVPLGLLLLYESAQKFLSGTEAGFSPYLVGALVVSMVDMYLVYRYTNRINRTVDASSLTSLARDCLNDFYTIVAALVGVLGVWFGYPVFDPLAGGLISLVVIREGIVLSRENIGYLLDRAPPAETQRAIRETILDHPDVLGIHNFTTYYTGTAIEVEFHAEVDRTQTLDEVHGLETDVRRRLGDRYDIGDIHIHLDPTDPEGGERTPNELN